MYEGIVDIDFWTALFTFCNMIITFLLLRKFLFRPVKKMIDDRQKEIDDLYADAGRQQAEAGALQEEYRRHIARASEEREEILRDATRQAEKRQQEILNEASAGAAAIRQKAEADIAREKKKAINEAKDEISGLALEIASKVVDKELKPQDQTALIEEFIREIGDEV